MILILRLLRISQNPTTKLVLLCSVCSGSSNFYLGGGGGGGGTVDWAVLKWSSVPLVTNEGQHLAYILFIFLHFQELAH